jgi:putative Holliday junction resolvase
MTKRVVSIDVGIKYIGLAVTDPIWMIPVPLTTVNRKESIKDDLDRLLNEISGFEVSAFVVGYPYNTEGKEERMMPVVLGFERRLKELFPEIPFFSQDESFSSDEAVNLTKVSSKNYRKNKKAGKIDSAAAAVILRRFMETKEFRELKSKVLG